ncbi:MAG: SAM-dependent methyltransferase [Alicyclobacillus sp.]|nr:SAM-dependent methyltransferase [Alicyclobacillus sp.]
MSWDPATDWEQGKAEGSVPAAGDRPAWQEALAKAGGLPFGQWMELALYGRGGYYAESVRIGGRGGDFVTAASAPVFAVTLARWVEAAWRALDAPAQWQLVELGPGTGELAERLAVSLSQRLPPGVRVHNHLLEVSSALAEKQRQRLQGLPLSGIDFSWERPRMDVDTVLLGNEVLDALPVERLRRTSDGWEQAWVVWEHERLSWQWRPASAALRALADRWLPLPVGGVGELSLHVAPAMAEWARLGQRMLGVLFDYGSHQVEWAAGVRPQGTLRAFRQHRWVDPLAYPGLADITADVHWDYAQACAEAAGLAVRWRTQGVFLLAAGADKAVAELTGAGEEVQTGLGAIACGGQERCAHGYRAQEHTYGRVIRQFKQLVLPGGMGERFGALELAKGVAWTRLDACLTAK